ncbi:hypothetical protein L3X38_032348 [Prunus dulcis]|uniref:Uncharacterized protein n=1 Tax=Prunus dulcis TaxID=3755 RepID=A0AAD4YWJ0_PRUDU|nr:hypothetical protein L3X38_032345 [Prunus dulcis]KAI5323276.1 hypothetical protein L3X38_032348 [Prunus dulcis]
MEGRSSPLAWRPCTGQASQLSLVCERATASNVNSSRLLFRIDNLRPKLLTSKNQTIVNLGEEYLPSRFFSCLRLAELQLLLLERDRSGYSRWSDELRIVLRELFCLNKTRPEFSGISTSVKTQTLLILAFAEPNL